jgi:signal transduction histidine kinase
MIGEIKWKIRSLSESENSFKLLISESPVGIVSFDNNQSLHNTNRIVSDVIGVSVNAYQGISIEEFIYLLKSKSKIITKDKNMNSNTENIIKNLSRGNFNLKTHQGRHLKVINVDINTKKVSRVFYFMDVTNELNLDQMKSEFIARAAHELRTPITSINGYAELLTEMDDKINDKDRFLELIRSESDDVVSLLNELLDLSKIDAGVSDKLSIKPASVHEFKLMCEAFNYPDDNRKVELEIENGLSYINCDIKRIKQAIKSCLSNAFKFSSQSTSVKCRVSKIIQKTETLIKFEISDNGIGMTDEEASMAFDRFYKADKSCGTTGTGLGLTLVKEIVEMHHGSIRIKSQASMGTVISIYLPTDLK